MLKFDKAIYLSFLAQSILSVRLSNCLSRSDVLLFLVFINKVHTYFFIPFLNSLSCYTPLSEFFCSIQSIYDLSYLI